MANHDDFEQLSDIESRAWDNADVIINLIDDHPGMTAVPVCAYESAADFKTVVGGDGAAWNEWRASHDRMIDIVEDARDVEVVDVVVKPDELRRWLRENSLDNDDEARDKYAANLFSEEIIAEAAYENFVEERAAEQAATVSKFLDDHPQLAEAAVPSFTPEAYQAILTPPGGLAWETWWDAHCLMIDLVEKDRNVELVEIFLDPREFRSWLSGNGRKNDPLARLDHVASRFRDMTYDDISAHQTLAVAMDFKLANPGVDRVPIVSYQSPADFRAVVRRGEYQCWSAWRAGQDHILDTLTTLGDLEPVEVFVDPKSFHRWLDESGLDNDEKARQQFVANVFFSSGA